MQLVLVIKLQVVLTCRLYYPSILVVKLIKYQSAPSCFNPQIYSIAGRHHRHGMTSADAYEYAWMQVFNQELHHQQLILLCPRSSPKHVYWNGFIMSSWMDRLAWHSLGIPVEYGSFSSICQNTKRKEITTYSTTYASASHVSQQLLARIGFCLYSRLG